MPKNPKLSTLKAMLCIDTEILKEMARFAVDVHHVKLTIWAVLNTLIQNRMNKSKDARFATACTEALEESSAFFELRLINFSIEAVMNSGLRFTGKRLKQGPIVFTIPLPSAGRVVTQMDLEKATEYFADLAQSNPTKQLAQVPVLVDQVNDALEALQIGLDVDLTPDVLLQLMVKRVPNKTAKAA